MGDTPKNEPSVLGPPRPKGASARFFWGMGFLFRGLGFVLGHAKLWPWVLLPTLLTTAVTVGGATAAWRAGAAFIERHTAGHGAFIATLLAIVLFFFVVGIGYVAFLATSLVATAPFAGSISERTEKLATGQLIAPAGFGTIVRENLRALGHTLVMLAIYLAISVVLLAIHFFSTVLAPFIWVVSWMVTGWFLAWDNMDLSLSRRGKRLGDKWAWLSAHTAECLGFGMMTGLMVVVPGLGLIVPAIAAVGGTLLFLAVERAAPPGK